MKIYRQDFQILSSDVDMSRKLRLSSLFTRLQEAAIAHTIDLGVTRERRCICIFPDISAS